MTQLFFFSDFNVDFFRLENCCNEHFENFALDVQAYCEVSGTSESHFITSKVSHIRGKLKHADAGAKLW